jgi:hypothetical protein
VLPQIIGIGTIDDGIVAPFPRHVMQPDPQLGLAEITTVGGIAEVSRIFQLAGMDLE